MMLGKLKANLIKLFRRKKVSRYSSQLPLTNTKTPMPKVKNPKQEELSRLLKYRADCYRRSLEIANENHCMVKEAKTITVELTAIIDYQVEVPEQWHLA